MDNQDILLPASLQSFPQLSQIPSQISDVLNGEKIVTSFNDSTMKYIILFCAFSPAVFVMFFMGILTYNSFYEIFFKFVGAFFIGCGVSFFFRLLGWFQPAVYAITNTRIICMRYGVIEIRTFEDVYYPGIHYEQFYIHILFQKYRYSRGRDSILLLKIPMSREIGQYISNQVQQLQGKVDEKI